MILPLLLTTDTQYVRTRILYSLIPLDQKSSFTIWRRDLTGQQNSLSY